MTKIDLLDTDEFGVWDTIRDELFARLPLRSLVWKSASTLSPRPVRTIPFLDLEIRKFQPQQHQTVHQMPATLLEKPNLNIYFVKCDDNETYRSTVRKQIKEWLNTVTNRKNQEWLIVQVTNQSESRSSGFLNMKGTVIDKIKSDFNSSKKDRCAMIRYSENDVGDDDVWLDLLSKLKEGVLTSFDQHVISYEEDIRRLDSQRTLPGWNYCTFFILKEGLAQSFEIMNLFEDALIQYDELDASFFQVLRDKALAWFGNIGGNAPGDDSSNLLDVRKKPYRDQILKNSISVFDFRSYLFGRQCQLLGRMRRPVEICNRAQHFISTFPKTLKDSKSSLPLNFLESWVYTSCMNVVEECEELAPLSGFDPVTFPPFNAAKAELLDLARSQLDRIGIQAGHLPRELPFTMALAVVTEEPTSPDAEADMAHRGKITNLTIKQVMDDMDRFDEVYLELTNRAIQAYNASGRMRSVFKLQGDIATLQFHRKRYSEAVTLLEKMPFSYGEQGWFAIENSLLIKCAACQKALGQDSRCIITCLNLLKNHAYLSEDQVALYVSEVEQRAKNIPRDIIRSLSPIFLIKFSSLEHRPDSDGTAIRLEITNSLSSPFKMDLLQMNVVDHEKNSFSFTNREEVKLPPGSSSHVLTCNFSTDGPYTVQNVIMRYGKVVFDQPYGHLPRAGRRLLSIGSHAHALDVETWSPRDIDLMQGPVFNVNVSTGRNDVQSATITLTTPMAGIQFSLDQATASFGSKSTPLQVEPPASVKIDHLVANQTLQLTVPYWTSSDVAELDIRIIVSYTTTAGETYILRKKQTVISALPLAVNVQDFFRESCLFSKFIVTCGDHVPLRIISAHLQPTDGVEVIEAMAGTEMSAHAIFPNQVGSYVYKICPTAHGKDNIVLRFTVTFRTLKMEVEVSLSMKLAEYLTERKLSHLLPIAKKIITDRALPHIDYVQYGIMDSFDLPDIEALHIRESLASYDVSIRTLLQSSLEEFVHQNAVVDVDDLLSFNQISRTIYIPVELPSVMILSTIELQLDQSHEIKIGNPVSSTLTIRHSAKWWKDANSNDREIEFYFDVHVDFETWLLSGSKRRLFKSRTSEEHTFELMLVPLRTGHLPLPPITVSVVEQESSTITCETDFVNGAETVLILPKSATSTFFIDANPHQSPQQSRGYQYRSDSQVH